MLIIHNSSSSSLSTSTMQETQTTRRRRRVPMERTTKIIRNSIHTFLQNYQYFTTISAIFIFPFSLSILLSQSFIVSSSSSTLLPSIYNRFNSLFEAAGFPSSSEFFDILSLKLSQTISSSIFTFPFTITFLLVSKAFIIQSLNDSNNKSSSITNPLSLYNPLFSTYICNSILILSANATVFSLFFFAFNFLEQFDLSSSPNWVLFLSAIGAVLYSIVLANALIISNLALVLSGMERRTSGYMSILKACVLIRGRTSIALSLALPLNLVLASIEALFHYRIVRAYYNHFGERSSVSMVSEGMLIAYLYSIIVALDTVVTCNFYKSCKLSSWIEQQHEEEQEESRYFYHQIEIVGEDTEEDYVSLKNCKELP